MLNRRALIKTGGAATAGGLLGAWTSVFPWRSAKSFIDSIGLNGHFGQINTPYVTAFDTVLERLSDLGVRHLREDLGADVSRGGDAPQFRRLRRVANAGFRFSLVCFDGVNTWVRTPPEKAAEIFGWCDGAVDYFEGSNEPKIVGVPDGGAKSAEHQRALYAAVKASPDLAGVAVLGPSYVQAQIPLAHDLSEFADFANIHPYPGYVNPETSSGAGLTHHLSAVRPIFGSKPAIATETGYHSAMKTTSGHLPTPAGIKARYLPRLLLFYFGMGLQRTYIYEGVSSFTPDDANPEASFGLAGFDVAPTPSYDAVRNLIHAFQPQGRDVRSAPLEIAIERAPLDVECLGFEREDGVRILAFWRKRSGWNAFRHEAVDTEAAPFRVGMNGRVNGVSILRFDDEGAVSRQRASLSEGRIETAVDDHLSLLVIS